MYSTKEITFVDLRDFVGDLNDLLQEGFSYVEIINKERHGHSFGRTYTVLLWRNDK